MTETLNNLRIAVPLADGLSVEAVYYGSGTLCLSTQAGCALGCPFCASGRNGLLRNLSLDELNHQVAFFKARGVSPRRLTLSGIGEPLHNLEVVREFIETSELPVSLTTTGAPLDSLQRALSLPHNGLMLSLHAGSAAVHRQLLPRAPRFVDLVTGVTRSLGALSRRARRRFGVNYLLLAGINDGARELDALLGVLACWPDATLHLLACNPVSGSSYSSPGVEAFNAVYSYLKARHPQVRRPNPWRRQTEGGCGTLVYQDSSSSSFAFPPEVS